MTEGEKARLVAWGDELRRMHARLREALAVVQDELDVGGSADVVADDLLLFCHGFCSALSGHHIGEDRELFPAIAAAHPELRDTLRSLQQDHSMIEYLISRMQAAVSASAPVEEVGRHLEGIGALMENHFRYEERALLSVLDALTFDADPRRVLGPL